MKLTRKQALAVAQKAQSITMTDSSLGWVDKPITLETMTSEIKNFGNGHWYARQYGNMVCIDLLSGMCFTVTL